MAGYIGYGRVAVSDSPTAPLTSEVGRGSGGGNENKREVLNRSATGESLLVDIVINRQYQSLAMSR